MTALGGECEGRVAVGVLGVGVGSGRDESTDTLGIPQMRRPDERVVKVLLRDGAIRPLQGLV